MNDAPQARLEVLRSQSEIGLRYLVNYLLANAEQAMLSMAGKAQSKAEQTDVYHAMRELRLRRGALDERFIANALDAFDRDPSPEPAPASHASAQPAAAKPRAASLGLMQEHGLRENIALENLASRARIDHRDELILLARHLMADQRKRRVDIDSLPVGPVALARAFMRACDDVEVSPASRLVYVKLFSRFIMGELGPFYAQCLAALPPFEEAPVTLAVEDRASLVEYVLPTARDSEADEPGGRDAMPSREEADWDSSGTPLLAAPGKAMAMPRTLLNGILLELQMQLLDRKKPLASQNPKAGLQPFDVFELVNGALEAQGYTKPQSLTPDVIETVNLVRLLFEHALRDQTVAQPVRRMVRLLQLPVLRAALQDPEVLSGAEHPVRALCREIGAAAIGWTPTQNPAEDELLRKLQSLVGRIVAGYGTDPAIFGVCLDELRAYLRAHQGRARVLEQRTLSAEVGRTEREAARSAIARVVASAIGDAPLPQAFTDFLRGSWSDAMFVIRLRDGIDSAVWGTATETTGRLVAAATQDDMIALATLEPNIQQVLARLGLDEDGVAVQLETLERAMGSCAAPHEAQAETAVPARARAVASPEYLHLVDKLSPDTWIEFRLPGHPPARARLLTKFPKTGEFLFVNREGAKAADWTRDELAAAVQCGEALILAGPNTPTGPVAPSRWNRV